MRGPTSPMVCGKPVSDRLLSTASGLKHGLLLAAERGRFVFRCATAASLAYGLATLVGLQHPLWAPVSALIVSQESMTATLASIHGRFAGTLIGVAVALLVNSVGRMIGLPLVLQIGISVALCATAAVGRPAIRVCLWTCPLVLVTAASGPALALVAFIRRSEVVLGAVVGGVTHIVEERIGLSIRACAEAPWRSMSGGRIDGTGSATHQCQRTRIGLGRRGLRRTAPTAAQKSVPPSGGLSNAH